MAFHGGNLEKVTDQVATEAAERSEASLYTVCQPEPMAEHLPSTSIRPEDSPALASFLDHVDVTIAIHGFGRVGFFTTLLLGGSNRHLAAHVAGHLRTVLPNYEILDSVMQIPAGLRGVHPQNPVNLPRSGGVQIELPPRVRGLSPFWGEAEGTRVRHTDNLIDGLAAAATAWSANSPG